MKKGKQKNAITVKEFLSDFYCILFLVLFANFLELSIWYFLILVMPNYCFVLMAAAFHGFLCLVIVRDFRILQDERINIIHINNIYYFYCSDTGFSATTWADSLVRYSALRVPIPVNIFSL